jgi:hypothetical protein
LKWFRCDLTGSNCRGIPGATAGTYTVTSADVGSRLRVFVTGTNALGATTVSSPATDVVTGPPHSIRPPALSGVAEVGETLTTDDGVWSGTQPLVYTYRWRRCDTAGLNCATIDGASDASYVLTSADAGATIRVRVYAANDFGTASRASAPSPVVAAGSPQVVTSPTVSGTAQDGSVLVGDEGTWSGTQPISFVDAWERCDTAGASCQTIAGATESTYTAGPADVGYTLRYVVTASNAGGTVEAESAPTPTVAAQAPTNVTAPTISGTAATGSVLTAGRGTWTGTPPIAFAYRWVRCDSFGSNCVATGVTASSYTVSNLDLGYRIRVWVTATNVGGSVLKTSSATPVVSR